MTRSKESQANLYKQPWTLSTAVYSCTQLQKKLISALVFKEKEAIDVALFDQKGRMIDPGAIKRVVIESNLIRESNGKPVSHNHFCELKDAIDKLCSFRIRVYHEKDKTYENIAFITRASFDEKGKITFDIYSNIWKRLCEIYRRYSQLELEAVMKFRSVYSSRMYDLISNKPERYPLGQLREILDCSDKYPRMSDFRKRVLDVARKEILDVTGKTFDYRLQMKGKEVSAIWILPVRSAEERDLSLLKRAGYNVVFSSETVSTLKSIGWTDREFEEHFNLLFAAQERIPSLPSFLKNVYSHTSSDVESIVNPIGYSVNSIRNRLIEESGELFCE